MDLQHRGRKWCSIPLDFRADLILKSAKMTEIDRISLVLLSIHINWEGKSNVLPISVISADLRIKSARKSSGMEHHLRLKCCKCFSRAMQLCFVTFAVFLDGLFEGSDVSKRAEEKNDDISLIFYRRNLQKKPQGSAWQSKSRFSNGGIW